MSAEYWMEIRVVTVLTQNDGAAYLRDPRTFESETTVVDAMRDKYARIKLREAAQDIILRINQLDHADG